LNILITFQIQNLYCILYNLKILCLQGKNNCPSMYKDLHYKGKWSIYCLLLLLFIWWYAWCFHSQHVAEQWARYTLPSVSADWLRLRNTWCRWSHISIRFSAWDLTRDFHGISTYLYVSSSTSNTQKNRLFNMITIFLFKYNINF
jgi:hypothetical protein